MKIKKSLNGPSNVVKVDEGLRIVFGFAQICKNNGEDYYDTDNQHFPEDVTTAAWADFMEKARLHKAMHDGESVGEVVFAFPLMEDIAKSLGVETSKNGIITGVRVHDDTILAKYKSGEYAGFSIGGSAEFEDV